MIMGMINCDNIIRMKSIDYENEAEDKIQSHSGWKSEMKWSFKLSRR